MRILAVLSAVATIAIAAPALEEYNDSKSVISNDFTIKQQREKKSILPETLAEKSSEPTSDLSLVKTSTPVGPSSSAARTFSSFKKPIIVKKKIGYHLYRDSDEEQAQADSRESCKKQIKVKLCDDNMSEDKMKSASIDHTQGEVSETEIKHSINMAKEAVETFQRDLQKMEHDSSETNGQKHKKLGDNKELREDIEKARQALEHIQRKFKNLDSTTNMEDENDADVKSKMMNSDEDRLLQWKLAGNRQKDLEISRNLEDNFTNRNKELVTTTGSESNSLKDLDEQKKTVATVEDIDSKTRTTIKETDNGNGMSSFIEDIGTKMEIQSDNLKKAGIDNDMSRKDSTNNSMHLKHSEAKESEECNDHQKIKDEQPLKEDKQRDHKDDTKSIELNTHNMDMETKVTRENLENKEKMLNINSDQSAVENHMKMSENELRSKQLKSSANDQMTHESKHIDTLTRKDDKESTMRKDQSEAKDNHARDQFDQSKLLEKTSKDSMTDHSQNNINNEANSDKSHQGMNLHRSELKETSFVNSEDHAANLHKSLETDMNLQRSSGPLSASNIHSEKKEFTTNEHHDSEKINEHSMQAHLRATSDFNKELLNNMEFTDSPQMNLKKPAINDNSHTLKNKNSQLLERHVPQVQPNSEHLQTMMHFSDNSQHISNQKAQLKMAPSFNDDHPSFNVQFNSPQRIEEQTIEQSLMPFKAVEDLHEKHFHDQSVFSDPLKIHRAHESDMNLEKLKAAPHAPEGNMQMDGSSQHFSIDSSMPFRMTKMGNQHMDLSAQQRWAQANSMNAHNLHNHDNFVSRNSDHTMMPDKVSLDGTMHPNSFMQMRGAPKMAMEYQNLNQWNRNQGAYRSSYGPSMSSSYGSGGGSGSAGSAVGLFPNANVGNCAVPLLLSCSPSVISGSLAKTNTYNTPSYRSEDINFVKKRNTDIGKVISDVKRHTYHSATNRP